MAGHILLAEDDKALSALMQDFFRAAGVAVTPAYDGEQALVLAQAQPFDLLVLDVMMPHLNGLEVCEAVRQESDVPVISSQHLGRRVTRWQGSARARTIISPSRFRFRCWWQRRRRSCGGPAGCGWARVSSATRIS